MFKLNIFKKNYSTKQPKMKHFKIKHFRYLHFIYTIMWALLYLVLTLILHATKVDSKVYSFLDWVNNPGLAAGLGVGFAIAAGVVGQAINYGCYALRLLFHGKNCCNAKVENSNETV